MAVVAAIATVGLAGVYAFYKLGEGVREQIGEGAGKWNEAGINEFKKTAKQVRSGCGNCFKLLAASLTIVGSIGTGSLLIHPLKQEECLSNQDWLCTTLKANTAAVVTFGSLCLCGLMGLMMTEVCSSSSSQTKKSSSLPHTDVYYTPQGKLNLSEAARIQKSWQS